MTTDPLFIENPGAVVKKPISAYLYSYVRNNPMSYVDENGELEKGLFEVDHRLGVYDNITLQANSDAEAMFQRIVGGGIVAMIAAPLLAPVITAAAPFVGEAITSVSAAYFTASLETISATSSVIGVSATLTMIQASQNALLGFMPEAPTTVEGSAVSIGNLYLDIKKERGVYVDEILMQHMNDVYQPLWDGLNTEGLFRTDLDEQ